MHGNIRKYYVANRKGKRKHENIIQMESTNLPEAFANLDRRLPENCVEYFLFLIDSIPGTRHVLSELHAVRNVAVDLCDSLTKDYIWQRGEFQLTLKKERGMQPCTMTRERRQEGDFSPEGECETISDQYG